MPLPDDLRESLALWLRLTLTPGISAGTVRALLARFGLPEDIFAAGRTRLTAVLDARRAHALLADDEELGHHISNILGGMYSLGGLPDSALIEYRVRFDPIFDRISFQGVPDIRTLVFRGVPVLAMVRLPILRDAALAGRSSG